jgi:hypothetical protein
MNNLVKYLVTPFLLENDLKEFAKQLGKLYHFTTYNGIDKILTSDTFNSSVDKAKNFTYFFSTTRDKLLYIKDPKISGSTVRIVLDGDKLSNKYKSVPYYYYHDEMVDEPNPKYDQDESEERIMLDDKKYIFNAKDYIKEIHFILDKLEGNQFYIDRIKELLNKYPDIKCFYKEKPITIEQYESMFSDKQEINELEDYEVKYWAIHADVFDALKKDPDKVYNLLKDELPGERRKALEYFYREYFLKPEKLKENCGCMQTQQPIDFRSALASLTKHMMDQGLNIAPLPKVKIINNDIENAKNILGKTAYYDPNNCSITLYTLDRHPKDVLRSYSHEMIHRIQDNDGKLNNVNTTNTNEDSNLQELEKEAYLNGNIIFRNWEDSIKNK